MKLFYSLVSRKEFCYKTQLLFDKFTNQCNFMAPGHCPAKNSRMWQAGHAVVSPYDQRLKALLSEVAAVYKPQTDLLMQLPEHIDIGNTSGIAIPRVRKKRLILGALAMGMSVLADAKASGELHLSQQPK